MLISPINCSFNDKNKTINFKACIVEKVKPRIVLDEVAFLNNKTIMLKKGLPFFEAIKKFIDATKYIIKNELEYLTFVDFIELNRFLNILKKFPKDVFEKRRIYGILGSGANKTAFLLDKKEVLCACDDMTVFNKRPLEDFDLPVLNKGYCDKREEFGWFIRNQGKPITGKELKELEDKILKKGYMFEDWFEEQACKYNDEIYLLDFECVKKKM